MSRSSAYSQEKLEEMAQQVRRQILNKEYGPKEGLKRHPSRWFILVGNDGAILVTEVELREGVKITYNTAL